MFSYGTPEREMVKSRYQESALPRLMSSSGFPALKLVLSASFWFTSPFFTACRNPSLPLRAPCERASRSSLSSVSIRDFVARSVPNDGRMSPFGLMSTDVMGSIRGVTFSPEKVIHDASKYSIGSESKCSLRDASSTSGRYSESNEIVNEKPHFRVFSWQFAPLNRAAVALSPPSR